MSLQDLLHGHLVERDYDDEVVALSREIAVASTDEATRGAQRTLIVLHRTGDAVVRATTPAGLEDVADAEDTVLTADMVDFLAASGVREFVFDALRGIGSQVLAGRTNLEIAQASGASLLTRLSSEGPPPQDLVLELEDAARRAHPDDRSDAQRFVLRHLVAWAAEQLETFESIQRARSECPDEVATSNEEPPAPAAPRPAFKLSRRATT